MVDAAGGWVLPGFIDLHADYIEQMAAPRPTAVMDFHLAIREAERELLTHGVTTMFHSVCFYAHSEFGRGPMREPENARRFVAVVQAAHRQSHLIRHRVHARFEIDSLDRVGSWRTTCAPARCTSSRSWTIPPGRDSTGTWRCTAPR